jgi:hypothetical protein
MLLPIHFPSSCSPALPKAFSRTWALSRNWIKSVCSRANQSETILINFSLELTKTRGSDLVMLSIGSLLVHLRSRRRLLLYSKPTAPLSSADQVLLTSISCVRSPKRARFSFYFSLMWEK